MEIMKMNADHVASVAAIETECFGRDGWSEKSVAGELTNELALWLVAVEDGVVAGYVGKTENIAPCSITGVTVKNSSVSGPLVLPSGQACV